MDKTLRDPLPMETLGDIPSLLQRYASGELTPSKVVQAVHARIQDDPDHIWIYKLPLDALRDYALELEARASDMAALPLYGVPFAIKDNIDLAGVPTTAACPAFSYTPRRQLNSRAEIDRCRRNSHRQDKSRSVCHRAQRHTFPLWRLPQRIQPRIYFRRFKLGLCGGACQRAGELQSGNRHRRFRQGACGFQ